MLCKASAMQILCTNKRQTHMNVPKEKVLTAAWCLQILHAVLSKEVHSALPTAQQHNKEFSATFHCSVLPFFPQLLQAKNQIRIQFRLP